MSTSDQDPVQRKLQFEWYAALLTVIGGFVIAIAVAAYFSFSSKPPAQTVTAPQAAPTQAEAQRAQAVEFAKMGAELCGLELASAKNFGVVPNYGQLASAMPRATDRRGRYVCIAATTVTKYLLAGDLLCKNLKDSRCVSLVSVAQDDGTVLYQRQ